MKSVNVKICGLMHKEDVDYCLKAGVNILGFVTEYPLPVPWNLMRKEAAILMEQVGLPFKSCIVTGGAPEKVIGLASELKPSLIQLHYRETLKDTIRIADALLEMNIGVIKTIPPDIKERIYQFGTDDLEKIVNMLCHTNVTALLADSRTPDNANHTGFALNLGFSKKIYEVASKPVILAGGITPDNVLELLQICNTGYIDIMTGVESSPGVKDHAKIAELIQLICPKK